MDCAVLPEAPNHPTCFRIERKKVIADGGKEALLASLFVLPEDKTALPPSTSTRPLGCGIPLPDFPTRGCIERDDFSSWRSRIEHAGHDQIVRLIFALVSG